jgi:hypothetical protein
VVKIRDVVERSDVAVPTGNIFNTKTVKMHAVAHYVFTLAKPGNLQDATI